MAQITAEEVYGPVVHPLALSERLKLATLILNDIPPQAVVDYSEEWTEEDMRDLTIYSLRYAFGVSEKRGKTRMLKAGDVVAANVLNASRSEANQKAS